MSVSNNSENWLTVWNERSPERADWNGFEGCFGGLDEYLAYVTAVADVIRSTLSISANDRVLDLGCGTGRVASEIAGRAASLVGIDFSVPLWRWRGKSAAAPVSAMSGPT